MISTEMFEFRHSRYNQSELSNRAGPVPLCCLTSRHKTCNQRQTGQFLPLKRLPAALSASVAFIKLVVNEQ